MRRTFVPPSQSNSPVTDELADATPAVGPPAPVARSRRSRRLRRATIAAGVVALLLVVPGISYAKALAYPGSASVQMRSVEWVRDHGGSPLIDRVENWYYTTNSPQGSVPDPAALPAAKPAGRASARTAAMAPPTRLPVLTGHPRKGVAGEGVWVPGRLDAKGTPALYTSFVRPDRAHPSVVAGVSWIRAADTRTHFMAGTREPSGGGWPGDARVTPSEVPTLAATFNSGWKLSGARGGLYLAGRTAKPLRDGQASLVINDSGVATVGQWGRDVRMTSHVAAVRQNLALIVDHGRPAPGLTANQKQRWGNTKNQFQYTWRSAVGVDAGGNLVYVGGVNLTLKAITTAMVDAGVVRGMELDIHSAMVSFSSWTPHGATVTPTKLLPNMQRAADRYLAPDQRDFFYVTVR
jgi:hypothetical protein